MSVTLAAKAPASFEIKSANLPLVTLLLKLPNLEQLRAELEARFGDIPDFFDKDPLLIDLSLLQAEHGHARIDFKALLPLLRKYKLAPIAICGGSLSQIAAAAKAGLAAVPELVSPKRHAPPIEQLNEQASPVQAEVNAQLVPSVPAPQEPLTTLVVNRPVRSGQQIYARGRDLVVLAMVNPGAEVIADGHIHVYAPLRGRAIAGARGDTSARIFTLDMQPELIAIAGVYRTTETPLPPEIWRHPAHVHLISHEGGGKLVVTAL
ncbi:MAG: septum site-determining protein MinC [Burkholderiaceae bacterium]|jgi:septum site-determining protein MinC|nr:septum site-determining protein MinC [Burkholderiaceae bacterium]